jgi:hypothetical protein
MKLRYTLRAAVLMAITVATTHACPNPAADHAKSALLLTPPPRRASIVAWKPRAWTPAASANGLVVSIDPVDGAMGMPAANQLGPYARIADDAPVATFRRANGSVRATLDERFADFAVVSMGADGKPHWTCVHGTQGAAQFMNHPVVNPSSAPAPGTVWEVK